MNSMYDIVCKPFGTCRELAEDQYPLFGFAVADYIADYGVTYEEAENCVVFGAVLAGQFTASDQLLLELITNNEEVKLLVFDFSDPALGQTEIQDIVRSCNSLNGFTELENVYENRIVFARK